MNHIWTIARKELRSYFNSPLAYIFLDIFLVMGAWLFFQNYFLEGQVTMQRFFGFVPWIFLFLVPAITMRVWAEEKKLGTAEILLTMPVSDLAVVLGKFFGCFLFLALALLMTFMIPVIVAWSGPADFGVIFASYIGTLFLGASYIALGVWISAHTDNQIIAFILSIVVLFVFFIIGQPFVTLHVPGFVAPVFQFVSLGEHFNSIARGVIDSRDVLFYLSFIGFFLFLNVQQVLNRRFK
ncbi:MAG: ABC transporter permease subunit [Candidatus Gracilibacteria bacterium]|nr:ABC transporter permease subunit [bacterium]MDZ4216942.1 ABC transporter permease subunit [Candidatus Gracilibacteria bacterium]